MTELSGAVEWVTLQPAHTWHVLYVATSTTTAATTTTTTCTVQNIIALYLLYRSQSQPSISTRRTAGAQVGAQKHMHKDYVGTQHSGIKVKHIDESNIVLTTCPVERPVHIGIR
jgi:hypothetical protein